MLSSIMRCFILLFFILSVSEFGFAWSFKEFISTGISFHNQTSLEQEFRLLKYKARNINNDALRLGLRAYYNAQQRGYIANPRLTIIDYTRPSSERRLWVFDLRKHSVLYNTWVAHGKNSGGLIATSFSNNPGSLKSSLGVFLTDQPYYGKNGYSLRLRGLERGINDTAYSRATVIHGAAYARGGNFWSRHSFVGRSWGCPAVGLEIVKPLINTIKQKSLVFAFYPDSRWLSKSRFLIT